MSRNILAVASLLVFGLVGCDGDATNNGTTGISATSAPSDEARFTIHLDLLDPTSGPPDFQQPTELDEPEGRVRGRPTPERMQPPGSTLQLVRVWFPPTADHDELPQHDHPWIEEGANPGDHCHVYVEINNVTKEYHC